MSKEKPVALQQQVGGSHYSKLAIQPMEFSVSNRWDACAHTILKYITRHADKNGVEDLKKAVHCVELREGMLEYIPRHSGTARITMLEYLMKNQVDIPEATALKALDAWVWDGAVRSMHQLLAALDVLINRYSPSRTTFGNLERWPGDRLDHEVIPEL